MMGVGEGELPDQNLLHNDPTINYPDLAASVPPISTTLIMYLFV